jgi:hypothetical protein
MNRYFSTPLSSAKTRAKNEGRLPVANAQFFPSLKKLAVIG